MPPTKWQEVSSDIAQRRRRSGTPSDPSPSVIEDKADSSIPVKTTREIMLGGWRRSESVRVEIPVDVYVLTTEDQEPIFGVGKTVDVSAHGALLALPLPVEIGQTLRVVHRRTRREIECNVLRFVKRYPEGGGDVEVEFAGVSPHFWAISSPPADWDRAWVPDTLPQRPERKVPPAQPAGKRAAKLSWERMRRPHEARHMNSGADGAKVKKIQKNRRDFKWPMVAMAASAGLFILWTASYRPGDPGLAAIEDSQSFQVAPEDAGAIPGIGHLRLATPADFDPDAIAWLRSSGQSVSGKIPGFYSGSKKSNAYILIGQGNERHVVILADGGLRYRADSPVVALAARVPKELVYNISWADPTPPQFQGDGLLIVRAADDPASGVILFLQGDASLFEKDTIVSRGRPVDYRQVPLGRIP